MVRNILNEELGGHPGSYNPAIITNKEAHMIFCNINNESEESSQTANISKKRATRISDYFCKSGKPHSLRWGITYCQTCIKQTFDKRQLLKFPEVLSLDYGKTFKQSFC